LKAPLKIEESQRHFKPSMKTAMPASKLLGNYVIQASIEIITGQRLSERELASIADEALP